MSEEEFEDFLIQNYTYIPPMTKKTIDMYVEHGYKPGHFVEAVLANDLMGAFGSADSENTKYMRNIVGYVYSNIPSSCHGSYGMVREWMQMHADRREEESK